MRGCWPGVRCRQLERAATDSRQRSTVTAPNDTPLSSCADGSIALGKIEFTAHRSKCSPCLPECERGDGSVPGSREVHMRSRPFTTREDANAGERALPPVGPGPSKGLFFCFYRPSNISLLRGLRGHCGSLARPITPMPKPS
jgi:hypothetical protein